MPAYRVEKCINILKPAHEIENSLKDFRNWPAWSPWLILEPNASIMYHGEQGKHQCSYSWHGNLIGEGQVTLEKVIESQLYFSVEWINPTKMKASLCFELVPDKNKKSTHVTCSMQSKIPLLKLSQKGKLIGRTKIDFLRGLTMLKSQLETGQVLSKPVLLGEGFMETVHYVGIKVHCKLENMGEAWKKHIEVLQAALSKNLVLGAPFGLYHKLNLASTKTEFCICYPVDKKSLEKLKIKKPLIKGTVQASDTYVVEHAGEYKYIANAWTLANLEAKKNKVKLGKKPLGMEIYLSDRATTDMKHLRAEVVLFKR